MAHEPTLVKVYPDILGKTGLGNPQIPTTHHPDPNLGCQQSTASIPGAKTLRRGLGVLGAKIILQKPEGEKREVDLLVDRDSL